MGLMLIASAGFDREQSIVLWEKHEFKSRPKAARVPCNPLFPRNEDYHPEESDGSGPFCASADTQPQSCT